MLAQGLWVQKGFNVVGHRNTNQHGIVINIFHRFTTGINNNFQCWRKAFESRRGSTWLVIRNTNQDGIVINISIVLLQV